MATLNFLFVFIDIETGGLDPHKNPVLEIGALYQTHYTAPRSERTYQRYVIESSFNNLVCDPAALKINGLDLATVGECGSSANIVCDSLNDFLDVADAYAAQQGLQLMPVIRNPSFDTAFLRAMYHRAGTKPHKYVTGYHTLDVYTMGVLLGLMGGSREYKHLDDCLKDAGINPCTFDRHSALGDCRAMAALLAKWGNVYYWRGNQTDPIRAYVGPRLPEPTAPQDPRVFIEPVSSLKSWLHLYTWVQVDGRVDFTLPRCRPEGLPIRSIESVEDFDCVLCSKCVPPNDAVYVDIRGVKGAAHALCFDCID